MGLVESSFPISIIAIFLISYGYYFNNIYDKPAPQSWATSVTLFLGECLLTRLASISSYSGISIPHHEGSSSFPKPGSVTTMHRYSALSSFTCASHISPLSGHPCTNNKSSFDSFPLSGPLTTTCISASTFSDEEVNFLNIFKGRVKTANTMVTGVKIPKNKTS
jgi:hypothetical protein